ncbi:hypothetical protein PDTK01_24180 [Phycicoccus sp. DTK01]|nr:hypothetical protein PDTK01_24180 [Phycicoccus sp. DTK01]
MAFSPSPEPPAACPAPVPPPQAESTMAPVTAVAASMMCRRVLLIALLVEKPEVRRAALPAAWLVTTRRPGRLPLYTRARL